MDKVIYIAGGCFWGVEMYYKKLKGIIDTRLDMQMEIKKIQHTRKY